MSACAPAAALRRYLDSALPADEETAVAAHLTACAACRAAVDELLRTPAPLVVPGYELLDEVGTGGMGVVYRARDTKLDRVVAVKVVHAGLLLAPDVAARLGDEAKVTAALGDHPGIVPVTDAGELPGGRAYFVMKFVDGATFAARLAAAGRPLAADADLRVVERVARIAGYAHALPGGARAHRDLKPSNVLLSKYDEVFVADWGLSKWCAPGGGAAAGGVTAAGHGTWSYMPPEQAVPAPTRPIGAAADVFALGGILVEVLTGRPTYTGDDVAARAKAADLAETFARLAGSGADPELVALAERCLAADPAARPADGTAVADALRAYFDGRAARVREAEFAAAVAGEKAAGERRRRRWQLAALAAAVLAVAAVPVVYFSREAARLDRAQKEQAEENAERFRGRVVGTIEFLDANLDLLRQSNSAATLRTVFDQFDRRVRDEAAVVGDSPDLTYRRAVTLVKLSEASLELGNSTTARAQATEALALFEPLCAADPATADYQEGLAKACDQLVEVYEARWEDDAKLEAAVRSHAVRRALAERDPSNLTFQAQLAKSEAGLGIARNDLDDGAAALPYFRSALARRERVFAARPADPAARIGLATSHRLLAYTYGQCKFGDPFGVGGYPALAVRHGAEARRLLYDVPPAPTHSRDWERARSRLLNREMWGDTSPAALAAARELNALARSVIAREGGGYFWEQGRAESEIRAFLLESSDIPPAERRQRVEGMWSEMGRTFGDWCRTDPANRNWRAGRVLSAAQVAAVIAADEPDRAARLLDEVAAEAGGLLDPTVRHVGALQIARMYSEARSFAAGKRNAAAARERAFEKITQSRAYYQRLAAREPDHRLWRLRLSQTDREEAEWLYLNFGDDATRHPAGLKAAESAYEASRAVLAADPTDPEAAAVHDANAERYFGWLTHAGRPELEAAPGAAPSLRARAVGVLKERIAALDRLAAAHPGAPVVLRKLREVEVETTDHARIDATFREIARQGGKPLIPTPFRDAFGEAEARYLSLTPKWAAHRAGAGNPFAPPVVIEAGYGTAGHYRAVGTRNARESLRLAEQAERLGSTPSRRGNHLDNLVAFLGRLREEPGPDAERAWVAGRAAGLLADWDARRSLDPYLDWWRPHVEAELAAAGPRGRADRLAADEQAQHARFQYPALARRLVASDRAGVLFGLLLADWTVAARPGPADEQWRAELMGIVTLDTLTEPGVGPALLDGAECLVECDPDTFPAGFRRLLAFVAAAEGRAELAGRLDPAGGYLKKALRVDLALCGSAAYAGRSWPRARAVVRMWEAVYPAAARTTPEWVLLDRTTRYEDGEADAVLRAMREANGADGLLQQRVYAEIERGGNLAFARAQIDATLKQLPDDLYFRSWHGWLLGREGKAAEGARILRGLRAEYPFSHDPVFAEHLGDLEAAAGDAAAAVAAYRRSVELFPATTAPTDHRLVGVRAKLAALEAKKP